LRSPVKVRIGRRDGTLFDDAAPLPGHLLLWPARLFANPQIEKAAFRPERLKKDD